MHGLLGDDDKGLGYDPIVRARAEGDRFNWLWFKDGEKMTVLQRVGFGFISFLHVVCGMFFVGLYWHSLRSHDLFASLASGTICVCIIALGVMGLRNALKFRKRR